METTKLKVFYCWLGGSQSEQDAEMYLGKKYFDAYKQFTKQHRGEFKLPIDVFVRGYSGNFDMFEWESKKS